MKRFLLPSAVLAFTAATLVSADTPAPDKDQEKARLIHEWQLAKPVLETRINVDLPAALKHRKQAAPHYETIYQFSDHLYNSRMADHIDRKTDFWAAMDRLRQADPQLRQSYLALETLGICVNLLSFAADPTPIGGTDGQTIGSVATEIAKYPEVNAPLRDHLARMEQQTFGDEAAAKRVAAIKTNEELNAYLQAGARERYFAVYRQRTGSFPIDAALLDYMKEDHQQRALAILFVGTYRRHWNAVPYAVGDEYARWQALARVRLSEWSDDEAVRQAVTEIKDMGLQLNAVAASYR